MSCNMTGCLVCQNQSEEKGQIDGKVNTIPEPSFRFLNSRNPLRKHNVIMNEHFKTIVDDICKFIAAHAPREGLLSISIVGSMANPKYEIEDVNDLDVFYIYEDADHAKKTPSLSNNVYLGIEEMNREIFAQFSSNDLEIYPFYKCGPYKPQYSGKTVIMMHNLIDTGSRWLRESPIFVLDRCRLNRLLSGVPCDEINSIDAISTHNVINDKYGIKHCRKMIEGRRIDYRHWPSPNNGNTRVVQEDSDFLVAKQRNDDICSRSKYVELLKYCAVRSTINAARSISGTVFYLEEELEKLHRVMGDFKSLDFIKKSMLLLQAESKKKTSDDSLSSLTSVAVDVDKYLGDLEQYLQKG